MRILYVSPSGELGGAERVLLTLLAGLRRSRPDWQLGLVTLAPGPLVGSADDLECDTRTLPAPQRLLALGEHGRTARATLTDIVRAVLPLRRYMRDVAAHVDRWQPDVVHANGLKAHVLSAMVNRSSRPLVWHLHDYIGRRRVSAALLRWYADRASCAAAVSDSVAADVHASLGSGLPIHTIHNGVDPARFCGEASPADLDALAGLPAARADTIRVGLVATYARWKGHQTFLRAIASLPPSLPVRGYVIGGPVYATRQSQYSRADILDFVQAMGLERRVGVVPFQSDPARAYTALDIVVHASTEPEPFGLVVVEAMCSGRAIIASASGGTRELVDDGQTGLLHAPGNSGHLALQIERLAGDPRLRTRIAAAGRLHARTRFDQTTMTEAFANLYAGVVKSGAARGPISWHAPDLTATR